MVILCRSAKGVRYMQITNTTITIYSHPKPPKTRQLFPNYVYNDLILLFFEVDSFYQTLIVM